MLAQDKVTGRSGNIVLLTNVTDPDLHEFGESSILIRINVSDSGSDP